MHSDKIVKAKKEHLFTKTNGARELSFKLIFCLVEISNIKSADTSSITVIYTQSNILSFSVCVSESESERERERERERRIKQVNWPLV